MEQNNKAAHEVAMTFLTAYARKDVSACLACFAQSSPLMLLGTNLDEVFTNRAALEAGLTRDFANMDKIGWGEPRQLYVDAGDTRATVLLELPICYETGGKAEQLTLRYAFGLRKEAGEWKIAAGSASMPSAAGNYDLAG